MYKRKAINQVGVFEDANFSFCGRFEYVFRSCRGTAKKIGTIVNSGFIYTVDIYVYDQCVLF